MEEIDVRHVKHHLQNM